MWKLRLYSEGDAKLQVQKEMNSVLTFGAMGMLSQGPSVTDLAMHIN